MIRLSPKVSKIIISALLFTGFVLHFMLLVFPLSSHDFPSAYQYITPITITAFNVLTFPFIFLFGNRRWKDYMFYMGIITGALSVIMPTSKSAIFFITTAITCIAPILMVLCGHHRINWRKSVTAPFLTLIVLAVILVNEVMLTALGIVDQTMNDLLSNTERSGLVFGASQNGAGGKILNALCPSFFKKALFDIPSLGIVRGDRLYWPIVWIILPAIIVILPICVALGAAFDFKNFKRDVKVFWSKVTRKTTESEPRKLSKIKPSES